MRRAEGREQSSVLFLGKGILILSLVLISSVMFTLGYLVGKNTGSQERAAIHGLSVPMPYEQAPAAAEGPDDRIPNPEYPENRDYPEQAFHSGEPDDDRTTELNEHAEKSGDSATASRKTSDEISGGNQIPEKKKPLREKQAAGLMNGTQPLLKYTVQVGAFRNESDAQMLGEKLEKKGYNTRAALSQEKNGVKLYKVTVGTFSNRKDADILALKLKKSEGLKAFVTFQKNAEALR
ncbi:MAG: SPOR domain-containing protein [Nitrospirota bacterium]